MSVITVPTPEDLRRLRKKAGLTQAELAKRAGVSQSLIARIEAGTVNPRLTTIRRILEALENYIKEELTARDAMSTPLISVSPDDDIEHVVNIMWSKAISQVPVINSNGEVIGTIYEKNVVEAFLKYREHAIEYKAKDIMSEPLPIVSASARLSTVAKIVLGEPGAVLVMEKSKPVGIITRSDLMRKYLHVFKSYQREQEESGEG